MNSTIIAPSILSADFGNLQRDVEMLNSSEAEWIHVDIMDGIFVPNISFGFPVLQAIKKHSQKPLDVHLMISQPQNYIDQFHASGANHLTIHIELDMDPLPMLEKIKSLGMKAGIAINPNTPLNKLEPVISMLDMIILMSVHPGFGGQKFIPATLKKLAQLKSMLKNAKSKALIEIDGGVTSENAKELMEQDADILVAGNTVFGAKDPVRMISQLKNL